MPHNDEFECGTCGKSFPAGWRARDQHCASTGHSLPRFECDTCHRWFRSRSACDQHMDDTSHWCRQYECSCCTRRWSTEEACVEHEVGEHYYCRDCSRSFYGLNQIKQHRTSRHHRGRQLDCPFCTMAFVTATGLTHHFESGACSGAPVLDRDRIYEIVRSKDPDGLISKNLIGWTGSPQYEATERCFNGSAYECYFCHRQFNNIGGLTQHLNSPTHQLALYHCPHCRANFKTLAAMINHLESESCGFLRFQQVQQTFGQLIGSDRQIAF